MNALFALVAAMQLAQSNQPCTTPNAEATATQAAQPMLPATTRVDRTTYVYLRVLIAPDGTLESAQVYKSSGNSALDVAAMDAARRSTFSPKVVNCKPVVGQYLFLVRFAPNADKTTPTPVQQPSTTQYTRMCSPVQDMTDAQFARAKAASEAQNNADWQSLTGKGFRLPLRLSDAPVLAAVRANRPTARSVEILVRNYNNFGAFNGWSGPGAPSSDAVRIDDKDGSKELALAVFSPQGRFVRLHTIASSDLDRPYGFARFMAAYILLNDLLAGDTRVPRTGCLRAFQVEIDVPGVLPELDAAISREPEQDVQAKNRALNAYHDYDSSKYGSNALTAETIRALGKAPNASFVYRDRYRSAKGDEEIDVVRLSNGAARTYVMLDVEPSGKAYIGALALCLVGDQRCAQYYQWP